MNITYSWFGLASGLRGLGALLEGDGERVSCINVFLLIFSGSAESCCSMESERDRFFGGLVERGEIYPQHQASGVIYP
jgi:hypothetical protein